MGYRGCVFIFCLIFVKPCFSMEPDHSVRIEPKNLENIDMKKLERCIFVLRGNKTMEVEFNGVNYRKKDVGLLEQIKYLRERSLRGAMALQESSDSLFELPGQENGSCEQVSFEVLGQIVVADAPPLGVLNESERNDFDDGCWLLREIVKVWRSIFGEECCSCCDQCL